VVDKALLLRKLSELEEYLNQVGGYSDVTVSDYSKNWKTQRIVERTLQMMIETCVDIAGHIISDQGYRVPKSYADTFRVLHEENILDKNLFDTLEKIAKFRNVVVHHYDKIDPEIVVTILRKHLDDFLSYKDAIINMLKTTNEI
jgi:uncharacterized protein YutE (UPF0331/DUF86 family)